MEELLYHSHDIAWLICARDLSVKKGHKFIKSVWEQEKEYLKLEYRCNQKKFILDVMNQMNYLDNYEDYNAEFPMINRDLLYIGSTTVLDGNYEYYENFEIFFKTLRLRILFLDSQDFVRMKLRTLLHAYGYKRRSSNLNYYLKKCLHFYHIETFVRGGTECDIETINLDDMITFRVLGFSHNWKKIQ